MSTSTRFSKGAGIELTSTALRKLNGMARVPLISTRVRFCPRLRRSRVCAPNASLPTDVEFTPPASCGILTEKSSIVTDRKSVVSGKSVSVRVDHGGRRLIKKTNHNSRHNTYIVTTQ